MTVARHRGFDSREDCGLIAPVSISRNIDASRGGVAKHYKGGPTRLTKSSPHSACRAYWRGVQRWHMGRNYHPNPEPNGRHWSDIAYTMSVCHHGIVMAGRGVGIRTAAQGTVIGNDRYYAISHMVGGDERPSQEMLEASAWCVAELRRLGAGREVRRHSFFRPTVCPGPHVPVNEHNRDIPTLEDDMPLNEQDIEAVAQAVWAYQSPRTGSNQEYHQRVGFARITETRNLVRDLLGSLPAGADTQAILDRLDALHDEKLAALDDIAELIATAADRDADAVVDAIARRLS